MAKAIITTNDQRPKPLDVGGLSITVLASEKETDGYEIFHAEGIEGKGPGPHYHPWDESLYITKGQVHCGVGEEEILASPGTLVHIPAGTVHWFHFGKDGKPAPKEIVRRGYGRIQFGHSELTGYMSHTRALSEGARAAQAAMAYIVPS